MKLDWDTVKTLGKQYMQAQLQRAGMAGPKVMGIDEISVRKGYNYRIVVSDLIKDTDQHASKAMKCPRSTHSIS